MAVAISGLDDTTPTAAAASSPDSSESERTIAILGGADRLRVLRAVAQHQGRLGVCSRFGLPQTDRGLLRHGLKKPPRRSRVPLRLYGSWIAARASRALHTDAPAGRSRGGRRRATDEIAAAGVGRKSACAWLRRHDSMAPH